MKNHTDIDNRILAMVRLCVAKIETDNTLLDLVRKNVGRIADPRIREEWIEFQQLPWPDLKARILEVGPGGDQLRQNAPFGGILSNRERFSFFHPKL
jgi:hypothetical protein